MKRILVVDDFNSVRVLINNILTRMGYEVILATNGSEALQLLENGQPYNLLITDIEMPEMDGFELVSNLRQLKNHNELPVIFLTTKNLERQLNELVRLNISSYIRKPFDYLHFVNTIKNTI